MRMNRQVVIWNETEKNKPKPSFDRYYLISDGEEVSMGKYLPKPANCWQEVLDCAEDYCGWKKKLGEVKYWASLPLSPMEEHD